VTGPVLAFIERAVVEFLESLQDDAFAFGVAKRQV